MTAPNPEGDVVLARLRDYVGDRHFLPGNLIRDAYDALRAALQPSPAAPGGVREKVAKEITQAFHDFDECRAAGEQIAKNTAARILAVSGGGLGEPVAFLLDRLTDFENRISTDEDAREFHGNVAPAAARLRDALYARQQAAPGRERGECTTPLCGSVPTETEAAAVLAALAPFAHLAAAGKLPAAPRPVHLTTQSGQWLATLHTEDFWRARQAMVSDAKAEGREP